MRFTIGKKWLQCCALFLVVVSCATLNAQEPTTAARYQLRGMAKGRVSVSSPSNPLPLDEPSEIPLTLSKDKIHDVWVRLTYDLPDGTTFIPPHAETQSQVVFDGGSGYITIIPKRLGRLHAHITVYFADGYLGWADFDADIVLPSRKPKKLIVSISGGDLAAVVPTIYMELSSPYFHGPEHGTLFPRVFYANDSDSIPIPAKDVQFKLIYKDMGNGPSISIDKSTGNVTLVHAGHTLVLTTFQGLKALTCIDVTQVPDGGPRTLCHELTPPGMKPLEIPIVHFLRVKPNQ